jgi:hypothetical protein
VVVVVLHSAFLGEKALLVVPGEKSVLVVPETYQNNLADYS